MTKTTLYWFSAIFFIVLASCGGGSGSAVDGGDDESDIAITSLSDIPDDVLNPRAYDLTTQEASQSLPEDRAIDREGEIGGFSRSGCETDTMKKNIIRNAILPRMILCNVQAFEAAAEGSAAGDGVFNYWYMGAPEGVEGPSGVDSFDPRVAIKLDGSIFTFVMCNGTTKSMELVIDTANSAYTGHVIDKWGDDMEGKLEFNADGLPPDSFTLASFTQSFVENSSFFAGYSSATLEATPTYNIVSGFNSGTMPGGGGEFAGATYAKFDATEGTATYRMDEGSYPGQTVEEAFGYCQASGFCTGETAADWVDPVVGWLVNGNPCSLTDLTVDSVLCFGSGECPTEANESGQCEIPAGQAYTEPFAIDATDPLNLIFTVSESSVYDADVAAATLPSSADEPTIEFTSASDDVDCSTSDSWTQLTFTSEPDMADCIAMEQEMNNWQSMETCANLESQNNAGQGGGQ